MATADPFHDRLLSIVLKLPGAYEDRPWGSVHCKVDGKIFVGWGRHDDGVMGLGIRVDPELQPHLVAGDKRFTVAKYSGKYGGVDMRMGKTPDWKEIEHLIVDSYRAVAKKKRLKELDALLGGAPAATKKVAATKKTTAKKTAVKKTAAKKATTKKAAAKRR